jgi:tetratricopeptide (TPR) repeat protein
MKKSLLLFLLLILSIGMKAAVRLTADAPASVAVGEQFRLTYSVNTQDADNFHAGNIPSALEVLMGPSTSSQSSFQMINGRTSSSSSITYTYILCANRNGSYVIPPAHVSVGGHVVSSPPLRIHVSGTAGTASRNGGSSQHQQQSQPVEMRPAGSRISGKDLFITVNANKRRVHEQEPVVLTYKVYTLVDLTQLEGKMPDLKGFHTQEVKLPQQKNFSLENYHGRAYRTVTWSQYVMFPQLTGKLSIPSIQFDGVVVEQNRNIDPFDAFFNGGAGYSEVKKSIKAPGLTIQVDPLPSRPVNFSGGVGHFDISASLNKGYCHANDPLTLRVIVSGIGNLKLIKQPVVNFPKDFETYDAKVNDFTKLTQNGVEGKMMYDFLFVPRHQGKYTIPSVEYTYYDTSTDSYRTIKTKSFDVSVSKGVGGGDSMSDYSGQEDLKMLNQDIHFIKKGEGRLYKNADYFFASPIYWTSLIIPFVVFVILIIIFHQKAIDAANIGKMRGKKANKVATRRLKNADKLLKAGKNNKFYDEVLKTLWGYIGDKLNIPVEQLSKDNIKEKLLQAGVVIELIQQFIDALNECEFARFAPTSQEGNMNKVYDTAMNVIMHIEDSLKGNHIFNSKVMMILVALSMTLVASATPKSEADSSYVHENYQQAIVGYERILRSGENAVVYYNLGNAYYRTDNITRAVLNYERALLLNPGDADVRFNLDMARSKTIDKITPASEMFFVTWYRSLVNMMSVDGWAHTAVTCFLLFILLALLYMFNNKVLLRKIGFFGAVIMFAIFFLSNIFAYQQRNQLIHRTGAIIVSPAVSVKSTPAVSGTDLFVLHEGTKVTITDDTMQGWKEIKIADGKEGWIETRQIEII